MKNQLRRNAFNLHLKREKVAARFSELKTFGPCNRIQKDLERIDMTSRRPYWCSKLWNGGNVGAPSKSFGSWVLFLSKNVLFFRYIFMDAGQVSEYALQLESIGINESSLFAIKGSVCWASNGFLEVIRQDFFWSITIRFTFVGWVHAHNETQYTR